MSDNSLSQLVNQIHHGDCIVGMNAMPAAAVDLAFADPPFNIGYDYDVYDDARGRQEYLDWSRAWIASVHRALKPDGTFWLAIGDEYAAELKLISQEVGFHCRSWVIWYYTFGVNCKAKFSRSHAHLFHFVKDPAKFTFRADLLENRIPSARQLVYADKRANSVGRLPDDTWILRPQDLVDCLTPGEDTWYFPRVAGTFKERAGFHGCQMPEQLLGRIIRLCSQDGETVLDPFSGSATTLAVAKKLGRQFLGFDLSTEYIQRGRDRVARCRLGDPLDGSAEPVVSAPATPVVGKKRRAAENTKSHRSITANAVSKSSTADALWETGLVEAFARSNDGYSLDRMIADPDLNQHFVADCQKRGLVGEARVWNWSLFNLRKAGKLASVSTSRRTEMSWKECDEFLFASEIATAQMLALGADSLDAILCDPAQATEFDRRASSFAPGFTPLQYRWAALKLRKEMKFAQARAKQLKRLSPARFSEPQSIQKFDLEAVPTQAGLYLITGHSPKHSVYAGESLNLRLRFGRQFQRDVLPAWNGAAGAKPLSVRFLTANPSPPELLAYQSLLIGQHLPKLNLLRAAV